MKKSISHKSRDLRPLYLGVVFLTVVGLHSAHAATITQTGNDAFGESSFNTGVHWSNSLAPSSGNDYTAVSVLRTPAAGGNHTFGGDSLTMNSGSTLAFKETAATDVITVNNLILKSGSTLNNANTASTVILEGGITINSGNTGTFKLSSGINGGMTVASVIGGAGTVAITTDATSQIATSIILTHANNTYSGGTTIANFSSLTAEADGALGTGDVTFNGGKLTLQSGATNNYISDSANFLVASGLTSASVSFSFTGTDVVGGLSLNGGSSFLANGVYSASALNTLYGANIFSGAGQLSIGGIPEPSTVALLSALSVFGVVLVRCRRTRV